MAIPTLDELKAAKAELEAKTAPLKQQKAQLQDQINPLLAKLHELDTQIHAIERPELHELNMMLAPLEAKEARTRARTS